MITSNTNCGLKHPFDAGRRNNCRAAQRCISGCGDLRALNFNLYDGCVEACQQSPRPKNSQQYKCETVGGEALFEYYGLQECGFSLEDSAQHVAFTQLTQTQMQQQKLANARAQNTSTTNRMLLVGMFVLAVIALLIFNRR